MEPLYRLLPILDNFVLQPPLVSCFHEGIVRTTAPNPPPKRADEPANKSNALPERSKKRRRLVFDDDEAPSESDSQFVGLEAPFAIKGQFGSPLIEVLFNKAENLRCNKPSELWPTIACLSTIILACAKHSSICPFERLVLKLDSCIERFLTAFPHLQLVSSLSLSVLFRSTANSRPYTQSDATELNGLSSLVEIVQLLLCTDALGNCTKLLVALDLIPHHPQRTLSHQFWTPVSDWSPCLGLADYGANGCLSQLSRLITNFYRPLADAWKLSAIFRQRICLHNGKKCSWMPYEILAPI